VPAPPRKRLLGAEQRLALQLLAGIPFGAIEASMFANGIARKTVVSLIRAGLATTRRDIKAGGQTIGRVRITKARRVDSKPIENRRRRFAWKPCGRSRQGGSHLLVTADAHQGAQQRQSMLKRLATDVGYARTAVERTWLLDDTAGMAKKPEVPWLGTIDAPDKQAAVEKAAQEFKTEIWRLYAVGRRGPAGRAKSPAVISSANGRITWRFGPKRCGASRIEVIFCVAGVLSASPLTYSLRRDDSDFTVFALAKPEDAEASAKRFGGDRLPHDAAMKKGR
jgi:hypothetical protein